MGVVTWDCQEFHSTNILADDHEPIDFYPRPLIAQSPDFVRPKKIQSNICEGRAGDQLVLRNVRHTLLGLLLVIDLALDTMSRHLLSKSSSSHYPSAP